MLLTQSRDLMFAATNTLKLKHTPRFQRTTVTTVPGVNLLDLRQQYLIGLLARTRSALHPVVVTGATDFEESTEIPERVLTSLSLNKRVLHRCLLEKYASAFFKMAFSSSS